MKKQIVINSVAEMLSFGKTLGLSLEANCIIALEGDLGAGKTTLTKGIAEGMGINEIVNSPTFTIMKIYHSKLSLYHLDVYRLEHYQDDFELEEYFDAGGVCVIEWASQIKALLPHELLWITIQRKSLTKRLLTIEAKGDFYICLLEKVLV